MSLETPDDMEESKIFTPYLPSLLEISSVKVGVLLLNDFSFDSLNYVLDRIKKGNLIPPPKKHEDPSLENCELQDINQERTILDKNWEYAQMMKYYRAQEMFLLIPPYLKKNVLKTVRVLECSVQRWNIGNSGNHTRFLRKYNSGKFTCNMRSDGTVDGIKTVEEFIRNEDNDIRTRFRIACLYCLVDAIQALFVEMEASGKIGNLKSDHHPVVRFWMRWLSEIPRAPWKQAATKFFSRLPPNPLRNHEYPRLCVIFPLLRPVERRKLLNLLKCSPSFEDLRACMYVMTKDEERQIMSDKFCCYRLLESYLHWPLRSLFIEVAKKMWDYIDHYCFYNLLNCIVNSRLDENFDYWELFEEFWESSPIYLREKVREKRYKNNNIKSWFEAMRTERMTKIEMKDSFAAQHRNET